MRKIFALLLAVISGNATPVGNTAAPAIIQEGLFYSGNRTFDLRLGYEGDFVADARMGQYCQGTGRVDTYEQRTNSGTVTLNVLNRMDLYAVLGGSKTKAKWRFEDVAADTITRIVLKTDENFLWAAGARAVLFEWNNTSLGIGGRTSFCTYTPKSVTSNGISQQASGGNLHWKQWQVGLDFSYKIHIFTPYIGTKYSRETGDLGGFSFPISQNLSGSNSFENRIPVGLFLGCTLSNGKYFMVNVEGRLIDEEAVTVSSDFRF